MVLSLIVYNFKEVPSYNLCLNCNATDQLWIIQLPTFSILLFFANLGWFAFEEMQDTLKKDKEDAGARKMVAREGIWTSVL